MSIYTIHRDLESLLREIPETGEMTEEQINQYEELGVSLAEKQENTLFFYRSIELDIESVDSEIKRLTELKFSLQKKQAYVLRLIEYGMDKLELNEIKFATIKATRKLNPPKLVIDASATIPVEYIKETITTAPDKNLLKEALKNGAKIDGVRLQQDTRIEIK